MINLILLEGIIIGFIIGIFLFAMIDLFIRIFKKTEKMLNNEKTK
jgi:hypothetical protein